MTSNRPLEDWGKLVGDVPSATAILDRFLHHAELITITGRSYRLRNQADTGEPSPEPPAKPAKKRSTSDKSPPSDTPPAKDSGTGASSEENPSNT